MAKDVSDVIGNAIGTAAREAVQNLSKSTRKSSSSPLKSPKGLAAGAAAGGLGLLALAPLAGKGVSKLASGTVDKGKDQLKGAGGKVGDKLVDKVRDSKLRDKVEGEFRDKVKDDVKGAIPGSGLFGKGGKSEGQPGVGKGRRMPVQQDIDVGVPVSTVYNQWTQFEEWPKFMHRVTSVSQEDETHVKFKTKIWGKSKEFTAEIDEQRPDERIQWHVTEGISHKGVVTFHELGPRLTRIELSLDIEPGSLIEKAARGMRHVKRAVRADMARFKAYVLMQEEETGAWRGEIEDGDVKKKRSSSGRGQGASSGRSQAASSGRSQAASSGRSQRSSSGRSGNSSSARSQKSSSGQGRSASTSSRGGSNSSQSGSGSSQSRGRSSSRRTRGATNGSSGGSSRSSGSSGTSRRRSTSHS